MWIYTVPARIVRGLPENFEDGGDGVTPNDTGDGDTGTNMLQNFPEIVSATVDWMPA